MFVLPLLSPHVHNPARALKVRKTLSGKERYRCRQGSATLIHTMALLYYRSHFQCLGPCICNNNFKFHVHVERDAT